jgi:hypothetical protein
MINISKKEPPGLYEIYKVSKKRRGEFLNTWFVDERNEYVDRMITFIKVDSETMKRLYDRRFNPLWIKIQLKSPFKSKKHKWQPMLWVTLLSIDDGSFSISFPLSTYEDYKFKRTQIMQWIDSVDKKKGLNGEQLLQFCVSIGADIHTIDYG